MYSHIRTCTCSLPHVPAGGELSLSLSLPQLQEGRQSFCSQAYGDQHVQCPAAAPHQGKEARVCHRGEGNQGRGLTSRLTQAKYPEVERAGVGGEVWGVRSFSSPDGPGSLRRHEAAPAVSFLVPMSHRCFKNLGMRQMCWVLVSSRLGVCRASLLATHHPSSHTGTRPGHPGPLRVHVHISTQSTLYLHTPGS